MQPLEGSAVESGPPGMAASAHLVIWPPCARKVFSESSVSSHAYCSTISQFTFEFSPQPCWPVHSMGSHEPS
jgi:hypothetical protein